MTTMPIGSFPYSIFETEKEQKTILTIDNQWEYNGAPISAYLKRGSIIDTA